MFGFPLIDILVIVVYFLAVLAIGIWASRRIKNEEDYFLAGRRLGRFVQTFAAFGQATSSDSAVSATTFISRNGIAGLTQQLINGFSLPIFWITSVWYRRLRTLTLGDFFTERYNSKWMPAFYSLISAILFMLITGISLMAMTRTVAAIASKPIDELTQTERAEYQDALEKQELENIDARLLSGEESARLEALRIAKPSLSFSYLDENVLVWVMALFVVVYAVMGGLEAAFITDTLQGVGIILLSLVMIPFAFMHLNEIYGVSGIMGSIEVARSQLPEAAFEVWGSPKMQDFTWYFIIAAFLMNNINVAVQPNQLVSTGSAKNEYTARAGFCGGIYMKRWATFAWGITALVLVIIYGETVSDPDYIWGVACRELLGSLNIGLLGLMVACLMAALMSTADCLMLTVSSLLTNNLYTIVIPGKSQKHYIWAGRVFGFLFIVGGVLSVYMFDNIFYMIRLLWEVNIVVAASFWLGMTWRGATRAGAWASMLSTLVLFGVLSAIPPMIPSLASNEYLMKTTESRTAVRTYEAREVDVEQRNEAIAVWEQLDAAGEAKGEKPEKLEVGERFEKVYSIPKRSIFWSQGLGVDSEGRVVGQGLLSLELLLLDQIGVDLEDNPYALNETIRFIIRMLFPFIVLLLVSKYTKPVRKEDLDRFYVKMKTPVTGDRELDEKELALSYAKPDRFDHKKIFPNSNFELERFDRVDIRGVVKYTIAAIILIGAIYIVALIGM